MGATVKERNKNLLVGPLTWRDVQRVCPEGAIPMPRFAKLELKETVHTTGANLIRRYA